MKRMYQRIRDAQFTRCHKPDKYKKLLFCLCYFHSVLIERRKFLMLGWNIPYDFNDSDFEVLQHRVRLATVPTPESHRLLLKVHNL